MAPLAAGLGGPRMFPLKALLDSRYAGWEQSCTCMIHNAEVGLE